MTRIMIVEGERTVSEDLQQQLQYLGYTVSVVSSGREAVAKGRETDLVLMDITLKGDMDSITAAEYIHSELGVPVVYVTAYDDELLQTVTEPYGYVVTPAEYRELHMAIEMALHEHCMKKKVKESEQWLVTTLKNIGDGVITTDTRGCITYMNPAAELLTGWTHKEAAGKPLEEVFYLINGKTRQHENVMEKIMKTGGLIGFTNNSVLLSKEGTERLLVESGAPIRDETNAILGTVVIFRDVTEKRKMEKDLIQLKTEKVESISVLAGGIAHDFNNILTAILSSITLAKLHITPENEAFAILTEAEKASVRAKHLTQQLLTFSKGGTPVKEPVLIGSLIKDTVKFALSGSQTQCTFLIPDDLWAVEVDAGQISQVVDNVVINADHAMPDGGAITVIAENVKDAPSPGNYVKITIADEGAGIPEEYVPRIFEPYFTTKQKGSGLGLATAYSIVKNHDGYMTVDSVVDEGTIMCIFLPACEKKAVPAQKKVVNPTKGRGRVLLTDVEECVLKATKNILMHLGYEVTVAKKGEEAVNLYKKAKENKTPFDVVIVDLTVCGKMNGKETIEALLTLDPLVRAIVSSGHADDPVMKNYRDYGFSGAVAKPYTMGELSEILQHVLTCKLMNRG